MRRAPFLVPLLAVSLLLVACSKSEEKKSTTTDTPSTPYTSPMLPAQTPLTQADIDIYVAVNVAMAKSAKTPEAQQAVWAKNNVNSESWFRIWKGVEDAWTALNLNEKQGVPVPPAQQGDVDLVKANREKVEKAREGKEVK